jgi:hypothetical protein
VTLPNVLPYTYAALHSIPPFTQITYILENAGLSDVAPEAETRSGIASRCEGGQQFPPHTFGWTLL